MKESPALESITRHVAKLEDPQTRRGFRLVHWRAVIRLAQDEYDRELVELSAINAMREGPQHEAAIG